MFSDCLKPFILLLLTGLVFPSVYAEPRVEFTSAEKMVIQSFGPWPPELSVDSSNRVSGDQQAIRFGEALFFEHALGGDSKLSCASCHDPGQAFSDGRELGFGRQLLTRNTPGLLNLAENRWFGLGGQSDSLWMQSIRPILAKDEMSITAEYLQSSLNEILRHRDWYKMVFGKHLVEDDPETVLVNIGKALAAYQETLISPRTAFDDFRDALLENDTVQMQKYPQSAQRGLKIFAGEGNCFNCHFGPTFSNREFGDIGIKFFTDDGVDSGRYEGIKQLSASPYNRLGKYNDGDRQLNATSTSYLRRNHRNFGEFKVPGLRAVSETAPYMHNGSLDDLKAVVLHYSDLDEERLHADGEKILKPLNLSEQEQGDLVEFLNSLSTHY